MVGRRVAKIKFIFHLETKFFFFFVQMSEYMHEKVHQFKCEKIRQIYISWKILQIILLQFTFQSYGGKTFYLQIVVQICYQFFCKFFKFFSIFCTF